MARKPAHNIRGLELLGSDSIPNGGFILLPNRLSYRDLLLLDAALAGREITYLVDESQDYDPLLQAHLEKPDTEALAFSPSANATGRLKDALHPLLGKGICVVFVPGRVATHAGAAVHVPEPTLRAILGTGATTLPLFVEKPAEVELSIERGTNRPDAVFSFGKPLEREAVTLPNYQENLLIASEAAFSKHPLFDQSLAYALIKGLKKHGGSTTIYDGNDDSELGFDKLFGAAAALSRVIRKETDRERVGVVLPPGKGGLVANLAVLLAGKIPVNLNFTASSEAVKSSIEQAELDRIITADAFVRKVSTFPWPPNKRIIFIERVLPKVKKNIIFWVIARKLLPPSMLASMLRVSKKGGDSEAVLLFTSGSSGDPKGVVLTHRNLLANVSQFGTRLELKSLDKILGCLPLFHSFGSTVTLWYPILEGIDLVTYPNPLEPPKLAGLIEKHRVTLLIATPTFLRGYMRRVKPTQLDSLKFVVTGAEKLPLKLGEAFQNKFNKPIMEGYGLTETAPVASVNIPDPTPVQGEPSLPSYRFGSVGQLLPGMAARITDPSNDSPLPLSESGMIWLRGANIFPGYLKLPQQTEDVIHDGWFRTGDIGRLDSEGFLHIEGRLSRFSKIAGEMVPHETIEDHINKALGLESETEKNIAIVGVADEAKGEALVMLSTIDMNEQSLTELRYTLLENGIPSLWIPKRSVRVEEIPVLASGKLDIKRCEKLAHSTPLT